MYKLADVFEVEWCDFYRCWLACVVVDGFIHTVCKVGLHSPVHLVEEAEAEFLSVVVDCVSDVVFLIIHPPNEHVDAVSDD